MCRDERDSAHGVAAERDIPEIYPIVQPSESECSDDALSSKRDSVGGGAAEQARRARADRARRVRDRTVSGPYGLNEVAGRSGLQVVRSRVTPPDSGGSGRTGMPAMFAGYL